MIQENVDPTFIVFAYLTKDLANESDALRKPKVLGKTLSSIRKYANNVRPQLKEQVGFDLEPEVEVIKDMHAASQGWAQVFKSPLQAAFREQIGWLMPSYKGQSLKETEDFINTVIEKIHTGHAMMTKYPKPKDLKIPPPKVALVFKLFFNGMSKKEREEQGVKSDPVYGMHVIAYHLQKAAISMLIDFILALPTFTAINKLNTLMIPVHNCNGGPSEATKLKKAIGRQRYFQNNIYSAPVQGLLSLDVPNSEKLMARTYIMSMKCDNTTDVFLFTDANPSWDGFAINVSFSKKFENKTCFKAENLAAYAFHDLGDPSLEFFNEDMKAVKTMGWDDENNKPLTANDLKFDLALQTPEPDSQLGMMFDFSEMEEPKAEEHTSRNGRPKKDMEADSVSLQSVAFSVMSNFSWFFNPDGTE